METVDSANKKSVVGGLLSALSVVAAAVVVIVDAPVVIAGVLVGTAVGLGAYASAKGKEADAKRAEAEAEAAKETCPLCSGRFDSSEMTDERTELSLLVPSERPHALRACRACFSREYEAMLKAYDRAKSSAGTVAAFSKNYKGKIDGLDASKAQKQVTTDVFRSRDSVELSLKVTAAYLGRGVVHSMEIRQSTDSEGNYTFSVWSGVAFV